MVVALDPDGCFDYVLVRERESLSTATTWRLAFLRGRELDAIRARAEQVEVESIEDAETVLSLALRGWRNLRDATGAEIKFPPRIDGTVFGVACKVAPPEAMARLPLTAGDVVELLRAVLSGNQVGAEAAKKSLSPQP